VTDDEPLCCLLLADQTPQQREIFLVPIRREIEIVRYPHDLFLFDWPLIAFHETLIDKPGNPHRLDRIAFGANGDLMGVEVMQAQFVKQRFFDDLVGEQKWVDAHGLGQLAKRLRQMAIDEDGMTVGAVAGDVGNIVLAAHSPDPPADRSDNVEQNRIINIFRLVPDFLLQLHRDFECAPLGRSGSTDRARAGSAPAEPMHWRDRWKVGLNELLATRSGPWLCWKTSRNRRSG
jgi:hypothetical protein